MWLGISILLGISSFSLAENVLFPSGEWLEVASAPHGIYSDIKNTGSYLFNGQGIGETRLTLYIMIEDFISKRNPTYFRAHPLFMQCLQKIKRVFDDDDLEVKILSGFKVREESSRSIDDDYAQSGTGADLSFHDYRTNNLEDIAKIAIQQCAPLFQEHQRDLGVILYNDKVHVHMRGMSPEESKPYYESHTRTSAEQLKASAQRWLNEALEVKFDPLCDSNEVHQLRRGEMYPEGVHRPEEVVGEIDEAITEATPEDLKTLWQYAGTDIDFPECRQGITSNHWQHRCNNRLVSPRLYRVLRLLAKLVTSEQDQLVVNEAYKRSHDLQAEGRAAQLSTRRRNLELLSRLAICAGADYVSNAGNHILIAVRKQKGGIENWVPFGESGLLDVEPPHNKIPIYSLPEDISGDLPLFDSSHQENHALSEYTNVNSFKSKNNRYFRLDPLLVQCHSKLQSFEQKKAEFEAAEKQVYVIQAYMTKSEVQMTRDHLRTLYQSGREMKLSYHSDNERMSSHETFTLANEVIDQCAPLFVKNGHDFYLGIEENGICVGISQEMNIWLNDHAQLPESETMQTIKEKLDHRYKMAKDGHIIDPDDRESACLFSDPPTKRSTDFRHQHSEVTIRTRREVPSEADCVPQSDTDYCKSSTAARDKAVHKLKKVIFKKHIYLDKNVFTQALDGCFSVCATCFSGSFWEDKIEHCNNFIHWVPFELYNEEEPDKTNFYNRENLDLRGHACSEHCIDKSPLFAIIGPTLEGIYRPDETKSVEEQLYPASGNPSPLFELLLKMYAMHAVGHVTFWIQDEKEVASQRESLKVIMVYNKAVTKVSIYVADPEAIDAVSSGIANLVLEWTKSSCPDHSRDFIPEYTVESIPSGRYKRSVDEFGETLLYRRFHFEEEWLDKISYL